MAWALRADEKSSISHRSPLSAAWVAPGGLRSSQDHLVVEARSRTGLPWDTYFADSAAFPIKPTSSWPRMFHGCHPRGSQILWEPEAQLCLLQEKPCQHLTSPSPHSVPSCMACALLVPSLRDDNRIRKETHLIRLGILEKSCNPIAELGVGLDMLASGRC